MKRHWTREEREAEAQYYLMRAYVLEAIRDLLQVVAIVLVLWAIFG